ncbi:MAG: hypothetical protein Q4A17_05570 [Thermoguttaceae bacterium]|nr:hypothetical protein [Thermoguttaceae bacterium]MDO4857396.1 hypothetical protein [Thermoguttaceae bacterium]
MKTIVSSLLSLGFLAAAILSSGGCAQNQQAIARLEQENAQQRERIWQSNRKMEDFRQENEALRQQIATLQNQRSGAPSGWTSPGNSSPASVPVPSAIPAASPQPPDTTLGNPSSPATIPVNPATGSQASIGGSGKTIRVRKTDSRNVQTVEILPEKAKAIHYEGLHAEFQMKDAQGNIVLAPAPVVIMVTDPTKTGDASRISKWNYTAEDIADIINSGQAGISVPLNMAWAKSCPENLNLELHILYCTSDKRMLSQSARINLAPKSIAEAPQGGLTLESANPQVGSNAGTAQRPQWSPNP